MLKLGYNLGHYAGIMLDALTMPLCSKLCRHNVSNPNKNGEFENNQTSICHISNIRKSPFLPLTNKSARQMFDFVRVIFSKI